MVRIERQRRARLRLDRARNAVPSHQIDVRRGEHDETCRQQEDVRRIPAQQRQRAQRFAAAQQTRHQLAERPAARHVDGDRGRPVRLLVPRQQIAAERERQDHEQQHDARDPGGFARLLVGAEQHHPQHVRHRRDHDEAGAEEVQPAQQPAERQLLRDVAHALVRVVGRRHVEHRQHHAGGQLGAEQEQQDAAGDEPPAHAGRQLLVEQVRQARAIARTGVEPVQQGAHHVPDCGGPRRAPVRCRRSPGSETR